MAVNNIVLGSGYIYVYPYSGSIPADEVIETSQYQFGYTKGGASFAYSTTYTTVEDDNGQVKEVFLSSDSATLKCGAFLGDPNEIVKICPTAQITTVSNVSTVKIGGVANDSGQKYLVRFKHKTKPVRITIVGTNTEGFELAFSADDAVQLEPTFTCSTLDSTGVLAEIRIDTSAGGTATEVYQVVSSFADGANPSALGYYEVANGVYTLTQDTEVETGKQYFILIS